MTEYILASASPRRLELLRQIGMEPWVVPSECDENTDGLTGPEEIVKELSKRKAQSVFEGLPAKAGTVVIGADTLVYCKGEILGKPADEKDAARMLHLIADGPHSVTTGVTIIKTDHSGLHNQIKTFSETSQVTVYPISDREIEEYIWTGEPMDKAGSYAIQGLFSKYIKGIVGDYTNIVGLPVGRLYSELKQMYDR
ncbi:MAG: septum formation protein Maf [Lachnospiraceae bacterium]|nr:septum formation protein Maf [Lachnospiraceae bacterium]